MKMGLKKINLYLLLLPGIAFFFACSSSQQTANKNVAGIYMPGLNLIDPQYKVFHKNDTLTEFHFRINSKDILYTRKRGDSLFSANLLVKYELIDIAAKVLIDSASISFVDYQDKSKKKYLDGKISLPTQVNHHYNLITTFNDITRDHYLKKNVTIDRSTVFNHQHFLLLDTTKNIIFKNYFNTNDHILIKKSESNTNKDITLKFYQSNYPIAKPPFSVNSPPSDTSFLPKLTQIYSFDSLHTLLYHIENKGLYLFTSANNETGLTLFNFQENFPKIKSISNMTTPLRYISTSKEFGHLKESLNQKEALDYFWKDIAGSNDRARTLIREYYNRVENTNQYFTSYLEGWKTDRGIIYIIYGPPNVVYKNKDYENWIYGEENNITAISFVFRKVNNPTTNNDFILNRSPIFKNSWYRAVDSWRSGRVY